MPAHVLSRIVRGSEIGRVGLQIALHLPTLNILNPLDTLIEHGEWASRYRLAGRHPLWRVDTTLPRVRWKAAHGTSVVALRRPAIAVRCGVNRDRQGHAIR